MPRHPPGWPRPGEMGNLNRYLAPTSQEVEQIRTDVRQLRSCGLQGHSALFHGHAESLLLLLDLQREALAYLGSPEITACPGCAQPRPAAHGADCWVAELIVSAQTAGPLNQS